MGPTARAAVLVGLVWIYEFFVISALIFVFSVMGRPVGWAIALMSIIFGPFAEEMGRVWCAEAAAPDRLRGGALYSSILVGIEFVPIVFKLISAFSVSLVLNMLISIMINLFNTFMAARKDEAVKHRFSAQFGLHSSVKFIGLLLFWLAR